MSVVKVVRRGVAALVLVVAFSSCSSGGSHAAPSTGAVAILSFVVPASKKCGPALIAKVPVSYAVESARNQHVVVDGHVQKGTDAASNTITVPVPCDNRKHTIALVVAGERGHLLGRVKYVTTLRTTG